jgi:histone H3/H4
MVKDDISLPKAAVQKLIKQAIPPAVKYNAAEISTAVGSLTKGKLLGRIYQAALSEG